MQSLFDTGTTSAGFRLHYFEVYNWGTFDAKVYRLNSGGDNSLLTGGNGSGKTTLVDALLTLLVPSDKRFYNQSSGADKKKERDETSYVLGYYGKIQEEGVAAKTQARRTKEDYSVLLAYFENTGTKHKITLAQIRWWSSDGTLKKLFVLAPTQLDILTHIKPFQEIGEFKKRLKGYIDKVEFYDSFKDYSERFCEIFGMRSTKALSLFSQTVGIKVLGNLNEFIRTNMLDDQQVEEDFKKLRQNFDNLLQSHNEIEKNKAQQDLLIKILDFDNKLKESQLKYSILENIKACIPLWYLLEESRLLEVENEIIKLRIQALIDSHSKAEKEEASLTNELIGLKASLQSNEAFVYINQLTDIIKRLSEDQSWKSSRWNAYNKYAQEAGVPDQPNEKAFVQNKVSVSKVLIELNQNLERERNAKAIKQLELENTKKEFSKLEEDLISYSNRKSQIPPVNTELRDAIADATGIPVTQLPFVGELIRVREEYEDWEEAIEKLLRGFGLHILVPEQHYHKVNEYVNSKNLGKLIVYRRVPAKVNAGLRGEIHPEMVYNKIEIKKDSTFSSWIEQQLKSSFNYLCAKSIDEYEQENKAITINGLIKSGDRNEKDDRPGRTGKKYFILGWNNESKLKAIKNELAGIAKWIKDIESLLFDEKSGLDKKIKEQQYKIDRIGKILEFENYSEIDWASVSKDIAEKSKELERLKRGDKKLKSLQTEIEGKELKISEVKKVVQGAYRDLVTAQGKLDENIAVLRKNDEAFPEDKTEEEIKQNMVSYFGTWLIPGTKVALENQLVQFKGKVKEEFDSNNKLLDKAKSGLQKEILNFVQPPVNILQQFPSWKGDILNLKADIDYVNDFVLYFEKLDKKLPELEERFRKYMDESVIDKFTEFRTDLYNRLEKIEDQIGELNKSLRGIDFNKHPQTFIQLQHKDTNDIDVRKFKDELKSWQPDVALMQIEGEENIRKESFLRIKNILDELNSLDAYRKKVTDVRNWKEFSAKEFYRENGHQKQYYPDSGSLSGGEKAQFTYTVLGAAIAYQFGISEQGMKAKSFRFIAVDEAFSKLDPEKSHYLMELCEQLHLQLLVVTPLDKIHVAEPYIKSCHYVQNKNKVNSEVFNLTIEEYQERKKEFELAAKQDEIE